MRTRFASTVFASFGFSVSLVIVASFAANYDAQAEQFQRSRNGVKMAYEWSGNDTGWPPFWFHVVTRPSVGSQMYAPGV
jgi:hypothetical protein